MAEEFEVLEDQFMQDLQEALGKEGLYQHKWIMEQNESFVETAQRMRENLAKEKKSAKIFDFNILKIPGTFKSVNIGTEENPNYVAKIHNEFKVDTSQPFWRWKAAFLRLGSTFSSGNFFFAIQNWLNGPIGIRSLFNVNDTYRVKSGVNPETGEWEYEERNTLKARYGKVLSWRKDLMERFEASDERGLLSKDVARPFVQFYGGLGVLAGTIVYPVGQTVATVANTAVTGLGVASSVIWSPTVALGGYAFDAMIWDRLAPTDRYQQRIGVELAESMLIGAGAYFWGPATSLGLLTAAPIINDQINENMSSDHEGIKKSPVFPLPYQALVTVGQGVVGQGVAATAGMVGVHPATSVASFGAHSIASGIMKGWDVTWYNALLKPHARIPDTGNGFFTKRVSGPGLASEYLYQVPTELAVSGVYAWMENRRLVNYRNSAFKTLDEYEQNLMEFTGKMVTTIPGSSSIPGSQQANSEIKEGVEEFKRELSDSIAHRNSQTKDILDLNVKGKVKLTQFELDRAIRMSTLLLEAKGEEYLLAGFTEKEIVQFWDEKDLVRNNWQGLARYILSGIFGNTVLTPMEEADPDFSIEVDNSWGTFLEQLDDGQIFEDQDRLYIQLINRYRTGLPGYEELMVSGLRSSEGMSVDGSLISDEFTRDAE